MVTDRLWTDPATLRGGTPRSRNDSDSPALVQSPILRRRHLSLVLLLTVVLFTGILASVACSRPPELPVIHTIPDFELTEASGERFTRDDLLGRYHLVDFIFTECPLACPAMTAQMKSLHDAFPSERLGFVSISVDPDNDTLEVLRAYRNKLDVDAGRWSFLRGEVETVRTISEKGFLLAASDLPYGHSLRFVLVDPEGRMRGTYQSDDPEHMAELRRILSAIA